jgi:hypothetical protein
MMMPLLDSVRGNSTLDRSSLLSPQLAASSLTGGDDNKENDAPEQVNVKQETNGTDAASNQNNNRRKSLLERLEATEAGLGLSLCSHKLAHDRVQHLEREVFGKVNSEGTSLNKRIGMLDREVL